MFDLETEGNLQKLHRLFGKQRLDLRMLPGGAIGGPGEGCTARDNEEDKRTSDGFHECSLIANPAW